MTARAFSLAHCEDVTWFRDGFHAARGSAATLGRRIGLGEQRTAQLVLAVAELAANLTKHATDGALLLRVLRHLPEPGADVVAGVEVIAVDSGPGMADVPAALRDGMSTTGTLGIGLGAVRRLADTFDVHSRPGTGTIQLARFWPHPAPSAASSEPPVGGITRPISGEQTCGDAWAARTDSGSDTPAAAPSSEGPADPQPAAAASPNWSAMTGVRKAQPPAALRPGTSAPVHAAVPGPGEGLLVMSCDGLGHGPLAALAAQAAVNALRTGTGRTPEQVMQEVHRALRGTRGAAVAIARLEPGGRVLFCGTGNITATLLTPTSRASLLSHPGIAGHTTHRLRTHEYRMPDQGMLVMHSDGLSDRWSAADLAGLLHHPPAVIATGLLRQAATRRDDASVVIAKAAR
ncbi:SpoIIE family protein phosphatase [Streptomyces sp. BH-SS-21]|uniref:SpoIIE family protein phosphatase n=2 Tax=Streptomyces liliiviolaceus TaxID=2823109 RepID=A0A941BJ17_9ACTN|nr:SpoIIE family protein phosphatase [Streptomyces liliiviolaceus]